MKPNWFWKDVYLEELGSHCKGSELLGASGGLLADILSGLFSDRYCNSLMHLLMKLWIYDSFPFILSVLALLWCLFSFLIDKFSAGECVFSGVACPFCMNFNTGLLLDFCYIYASLSVICIWFSCCLFTECIPCMILKFTTKNT